MKTEYLPYPHPGGTENYPPNSRLKNRPTTCTRSFDCGGGAAVWPCAAGAAAEPFAAFVFLPFAAEAAATGAGDAAGAGAL